MPKPRIIKMKFAATGDVPNNSRLPVLIYRAAIPRRRNRKDRLFEQHFHDNGWRGVWSDTIYSYCHFHTNAHEALGIARGRVKVQLGGDNGKKILLRAGDMIILPAGTGHRRTAATKNLIVIGCYPPGQQKYNIRRSLKGSIKPRQKIARLPLPKTDPLFGKDGPLRKYWK